MSDLIQLLPDSVANQIAAGEVVQRPASVVKELVENAIDAGSTKIQVIIKDAGKTLIQVIDNGCGMSETDARMCFERHATSKIRKANDLFDIRTMGFRGEAMASIAAIATVGLKTKKHDSELGVNIVISGSVLEKQEAVSCPAGTNIAVKNLFFNVPARRKFLKSNSTELKHIMEDFQRTALGFPEIEMHLTHNDTVIYNLPASNTQNRIINLFGKQAGRNLIPIESETTMAKITGFVGKPEFAKKTAGDQFFFVNKRFMKHPYFYKAVMRAYENIIPQGVFPSFFIYFDVNPEEIDINIHPTKTEIKFENERALWPILQATVKEGLGKFNVIPSIDFGIEHNIEIPYLKKEDEVKPPEISVNPTFNPFDEKPVKAQPSSSYKKESSTANWEQLYSGFENEPQINTIVDNVPPESVQSTFDTSSSFTQGRFFQLKGKYIITSVKSGLMLIDQHRAHQRIIFDEYIYKTVEQGVGQRLLYPEKIELDAFDSEIFMALLQDINTLGFEVEPFGKNTFVVNSTPADFPEKPVKEWVNEIINIAKEEEYDFVKAVKENIVISLSKYLAIPYGKTLTQEEMADLNDRLFSSSLPNISPDGKPVISIIDINDIDKKFK